MKALEKTQMKINNSTEQLESKLELLKSFIDKELNRIEVSKKNSEDYKPNSAGIVQSMGIDIDNLCGRLTALYEMREILENEQR